MTVDKMASFREQTTLTRRTEGMTFDTATFAEDYSNELAVTELATRTYELSDVKSAMSKEINRREQADEEVQYLQSVISTLELSIEQYSRSCASLESENNEMKSQVAYQKNSENLMPI
jgi:chromosome segregation ATPase